MNKLFFVAIALVALVASATAEGSFKRERRELEDAAMALEELRAAIADQKNALFDASASMRNIADRASVVALNEQVGFLTASVDDLAEEDSLDDMGLAVNGAVEGATSAAVLANVIADSLPPLRSRSEAALDSALTLLQHYASHEKAVVSFENAFAEQEVVFKASASRAVSAANAFTESTDFTDQVTALHSRADALVEFVEDIDVDTYELILSNVKKIGIWDPQTPTFFYKVWSTYAYGFGWFGDNRHELFGGVHPSQWSDSEGYTYEMSRNMNVLRTFFTDRMTSGFNALIWGEEWYYTSSTNAKHTAVLFRIRNTTPNPITWSIYTYWYNYGSWNEAFSMAMNGVNHYTHTGNCGHCSTNVNFNVPANGVSTIIIATGSGNPSNTRAAALGFYNNCLNLPNGLEWVDDLATARTMFEQYDPVPFPQAPMA